MSLSSTTQRDLPHPSLLAATFTNVKMLMKEQINITMRTPEFYDFGIDILSLHLSSARYLAFNRF